MDNLQLLKNRVRAARKVSGSNSLTYTKHLEAACRLLFGASSLNHFSASPERFEARSDISISRILERIQNASALFDADDQYPPGYEVFSKWQQAAEVWAQCLEEPDDIDSFLWLLKQSNDISGLNLPGTFNGEGKIVSFLDPSVADFIPAREMVGMFLRSWISQLPGHKESLMLGHWRRLQDVAISRGLDERSADYYRAICREAYNHTWSIESMVALGILDIDIEAGSFFARHSSIEEAVWAMEEIWEFEEPELSESE